MTNYLNVFRVYVALVMLFIVAEPSNAEDGPDNKEAYEINGRVTDEQGQPVYDAYVSATWWSKNGKMVPVKPSRTNLEGKFTIPVWLGRWKIAALMAMDKNRSYGGVQVLNSMNVDEFQDKNCVL